MDKNNLENSDEILEKELEEPDYIGTPEKKKSKKRFLWPVLFILIAAASVWALTAQSKDFTFVAFIKFLGTLDLKFVLLAFAAMMGFIIFEALAIRTISSSFGYKRALWRNGTYSAADIYFSSITPSASGGQPASAIFMMHDKIPGPMVTVILIVNLIMYTFSIIAIGIVAFILDPSKFIHFSTFSRILIVVGCVAQVGIAMLFITLLRHGRIIQKTGNFFISLLAKIRIIRKPDEKKEKLKKSIIKYKGYVHQIRDKKWMLLRAFIYNFLQRFSLILVTVFVFLAANDSTAPVEVGVAQTMVVLGSNTVPIPGAMGIADYLLLDCFGTNSTNLVLLSRAISFYSCVIICGLTFFIRYAFIQFKKRRNKL